MQGYQTARRIINKYDQRATWRSPFEPVMRAAVDLDQLTKPRPPRARLMHASFLAKLGLPQADTHLNFPDRFVRNEYAFMLSEFFRRKRCAKVRVFISQQSLNSQPRFRLRSPRRNPSSLLRHKSFIPQLAPQLNQPDNLSLPNSELFCRLSLPQPLLHN